MNINNEICTCGRCGRPLKTDKSKEVGFGPVCIKKVEEARQDPPDGQTEIYDYIKD